MGTFTDPRDGKTYKKVTIGKQTWMAENLRFNANGSKRYGEGGSVENFNGQNYYNTKLSPKEIQANYEKYGRLYNWKTIITACPSGWHLPNIAEWDDLLHVVDPAYRVENDSNTAGNHLKATEGWNGFNGVPGNGKDTYGFAALPGGYCDNNGRFCGVGRFGRWWSAPRSNYVAYNRYMTYDSGRVSQFNTSNTSMFSIRCIQDT